MPAASAPTAAKSESSLGRIGRFDLLRVLGSGAQGTVYLARDSHLERDVAFKTLRLARLDQQQRQESVRSLLEEARATSRLQHPNVVTLFDAGEEGGTPYLVFEYVEGTSLAGLIRERGRLPVGEALGIALGVVRGIGAAHAKGIVHRDLKPANIMITSGGEPRIMDFGIARAASAGKVGEADFYGTPRYMAPEYISERIFTPASDLFSFGVIVFEMLAGVPPVTGTNAFEVLHKIANVPMPAVSSRAENVDERLDALLAKALARQPAERFESALAMEMALSAYLAPKASGDEGSGAAAGGTLEFLLRRMRHKSDFPALSETVTAINRTVSSERERSDDLCDRILKDFALTNKILRMVNSASFKAYSGGVSTISRAVALLGTEGVRNVAMSLQLFDHLKNRAQAGQLREQIAAACFSGVIAREMSRRAGVHNVEEAFICAMYHGLGRLLAGFYLPEEAQAIDVMVTSGQATEMIAATEVLGLTYEDLGIGVARQWGFPDRIVDSMRTPVLPLQSQPESEQDRLRALSCLSAGMVDALRLPNHAARLDALQRLAVSFGTPFEVGAELLAKIAHDSVSAFEREAGHMGLSVGKGELATAARALGVSEPAVADPEETVINQMQVDTGDPTDVFGPAPVAIDRRAALAAGIQDITETLMGEYALNDVLRIILETMYRGVGFTRVLMFVNDPNRKALRARFGFGDDADGLIKRGISVALDGAKDVFYAATKNGADILIHDIDAENIRMHVPAWYRAAIRSKGMMLFPIMVNKRLIGLIYADTDQAARLELRPEELNLLKTLRNQVVLAIRQKN